MPGTLLNLTCDDECITCDCRIYYEDCYLYWECESANVELRLSGVVKSEEKSGRIYRPEHGVWELWACTGEEGCIHGKVGEVVITETTWNTTDCPDINWCCDVEDAEYIRVQLPTITIDWETTVNNRDYRRPIFNNPNWLAGHNIVEAKMRQWVELDAPVGGTYLFSINPVALDPCNHLSVVEIGEGTFYAVAEATGTESRQRTFFTSDPFILVCDFNVYRYSTGRVKVFLDSNGCLYLQPQFGTWSGYNTWSGVERNSEGPGFIEDFAVQVTRCGSFFFDWTTFLNQGLVCASLTGVPAFWNIGRVPISPRPVCEFTGQYWVGPGSCNMRSDGVWFDGSFGSLVISGLGGCGSTVNNSFSAGFSNYYTSNSVYPFALGNGLEKTGGVQSFWYSNLGIIFPTPDPVAYPVGTASKDVI